MSVAEGVRFTLAVMLLTATAPLLHAELRWEKTETEISPWSTESFAPAEYHFTNTGPEPVTINAIRPDCDCVQSAVVTQTYQRGETGGISVVFKVQGQTGQHNVPIQVTTSSAGKTQQTVLVLRVHIREAVTFSEKFVYWRETQPLEPRTVIVRLAEGAALTFQTVRSDSPAFQVQLKHTADPAKAELVITPPPEHGRAVATVVVTTTARDSGATSEHRLLARVW